MKTNFREAVALLVCICFVFSFCFNGAMAADSQTQVLGDNEVKVTVLQNNDDTCKVMVEYIGDKATDHKGDKIYATLDRKTNEITMQTVEKAKKKAFGLFTTGKESVKNYKVKVDTSDNGEISATATDNETKKEYKIKKSDSKVKAQLPIAVAWLIEVLGAAAIKALLATAAVFIISSIAYTAATTIAEKLRKRKTANYYYAILRNDEVYIGNPFPNDAAAFAWVRASKKNNVFAITDAKANEAARKGGNGIAYGGWAHGSDDGWWKHYHPGDSNGQMPQHCWY